MTNLLENRQAPRNSNIELLRILSIILIVFSHFASHGNFHFAMGTLSVPHAWICVLRLLGKIGVNIFVLISGYYLVAEKNIAYNPLKVIKFLAQCSFYSIGIFCFFAITARWQNSAFQWDSPVVFPVLFQLWWFATIYFWLFILHPWLNRLLRSLQKNEYQKLIVVLLVSFCIIPSVVRISYHAELLWFIILYVVAGYVRLHGEILLPRRGSSSVFCLMIGMALFSLMAGLRIAGVALVNRFPVFASHTVSLGEMHNIFTFLAAFYLFLAFLKLKIQYRAWINFLASATFGIYLIHDHPAVRDFLWKNIFVENSVSAGVIPYSAMAVAIVYCACTVIDLFRRFVFERPLMMLLYRISPSITTVFKKIYCKICKFVFDE